jgi:hypothetical protein
MTSGPCATAIDLMDDRSGANRLLRIAAFALPSHP